MNVKETAQVLTIMHNAWPSATINDGTPAIWAEMLIGVDPADGMAAAKALMRSSKWFPSLAEFIEAEQAARRTRTGNTEGRESSPYAELDEVPLSRQQQLENVAKLRAQMREMIATQKGYEHKHGALGPCQVPGCPSVKPKLRAVNDVF